MTADRVKKDEYPRIIADYLGILPIEGAGGPWMSRQGTVMKEWLEAVGEAIDVPYQGEKVRTMAALVERVRGRWDSSTMSSKETRSGGGGNITERAFIALLEGLEADVPASMAARARELQHSVSRGQSAHGQGPAHVKSGRPFDATTPDRHDDDRAIRALLIRKGQPQFRAHLLVTYEGRCAVTACGVGEVLEAAHVVPYRLGGAYATSNGLLLRADLHTLFDTGLLAFDDDRRVVLHPRLSDSEYQPLVGVQVREPVDPSDRVPTEALIAHRKRVGL
ncbi:HNH endonuclease [Cellulosimicrobium sp. SJTW-1]|uniref:HNH endonuclease n=1 Tax=Cellulosimicrobium sp. SJTW-1 TaxID=3078082 RepID=UPI0039EB28C6